MNCTLCGRRIRRVAWDSDQMCDECRDQLDILFDDPEEMVRDDTPTSLRNDDPADWHEFSKNRRAPLQIGD